MMDPGTFFSMFGSRHQHLDPKPCLILINGTVKFMYSINEMK